MDAPYYNEILNDFSYVILRRPQNFETLTAFLKMGDWNQVGNYYKIIGEIFFRIFVASLEWLIFWKFRKCQKQFFLKLHWPKSKRNFWRISILASKMGQIKNFVCFLGK